jgi:hypothetical protein
MEDEKLSSMEDEKYLLQTILNTFKKTQNAPPVLEMQLHPAAAAALGTTKFPTFKFMVVSRLGGHPAPPGFDVRRFCQSPMTGFHALRVELSCSCTHAFRSGVSIDTGVPSLS